MMMTPDELRELADALDEATFKLLAAKHTGEAVSCMHAADYLRQQAHTHPAPAVPDGWKWVPVEPTQAMNNAGLSAVNQHGKRLVWETYKAMLAAAPAAPQAEPIADSDADYWLRNRQAILDAIERAGFMLMSNASGFWLHQRGTTDAQAEPLSDERIAEIQRAAYERAAQECIETAAELRRCADGCTDGRYDWKADGALDCADAIRALGRQQ